MAGTRTAATSATCSAIARGERVEPRPRRAADAWLGSLELQRMIRFARLLDDEPELHAPVLDVRGGNPAAGPGCCSGAG
jgi:hypothetical protein